MKIVKIKLKIYFIENTGENQWKWNGLKIDEMEKIWKLKIHNLKKFYLFNLKFISTNCHCLNFNRGWLTISLLIICKIFIPFLNFK